MIGQYAWEVCLFLEGKEKEWNLGKGKVGEGTGIRGWGN